VQKLLRLLSDPTRLRILLAVEREELAVNEIADVLAMSQSRISNHLRLLKDGEALQGRRDGAWTFYRNALEEGGDGVALWQAIKEGLEGDPAFEEDAARRREVLERRRRRSREHFAAGTNGNGVALEHGTLREEILAAFAPPELVVVDGGCGDGSLTEILAQRFARVLAFDHSPERLAAARRRVKGQNVTFRQAELDALPLPAGTADVCCLSMVLHHVPEIEPVLAEAARVLKASGRLVVADLAPHQDEALRERMGDLRLGVDPDRLAKAMRDSGFRRIRIQTAHDRLTVARGRNLDLILATGEHAPRRKPTRKKKTRRKS
jgi:SAM-dependent methyltransferase